MLYIITELNFLNSSISSQYEVGESYVFEKQTDVQQTISNQHKEKNCEQKLNYSYRHKNKSIVRIR